MMNANIKSATVSCIRLKRKTTSKINDFIKYGLRNMDPYNFSLKILSPRGNGCSVE
jgi:hypothetical protein